VNNFQIANVDTDSISFCKPDGSFIPLEERKAFIKDINDKSPEFMTWSDDGYYKKVIILKAKNYVLLDEKGEIKYKGSAIKAPGKELALREFIKEMLNLMLNDNDNYLDLYNKYAKEILDIKDIKRFAARKTITDKTMNSPRTNESKIRDAIDNTEYVEGNRIWVYFKEDDSLSLVENFDGNYSQTKLLKKLHDTVKIFAKVIDIKMFPNYTLKKNKELLENLR